MIGKLLVSARVRISMKFSKSLSFETGPASPKTTMIGMAVTASILLVVALIVARWSYVLDTTGARVQAQVVRYIEAGDDQHRAVFAFTDHQGRRREVRDSLTSSRKTFDLGELR